MPLALALCHREGWQRGARRSLGLAVAITGGYCCFAAATRRAYMLRPIAVHNVVVPALRRAAHVSTPEAVPGFGWYRWPTSWVMWAVAVPLWLGHVAQLADMRREKRKEG